MQIKNILDINENKNFLILLKGIHNLNSKNSPLKPVNITHKVESSLPLKFIKCESPIIINIDMTIVKAQGRARLTMFLNRFPFILFLFGSRARTNDGIPIVRTLVNVI